MQLKAQVMANNQFPRLLPRQKLLLRLLDGFGGRVSNLDFQKYLFLYCQGWEKPRSFEFVPYRLGAFSFTSYADRRKLIELNLLEKNDQVWEITAEGRKSVAGGRSTEIPISFIRLFEGLHGDALIAKSYQRYPYYATRSEVAERVTNGDKKVMRLIEEARPEHKGAGLATIGYEGLTIENYLNRLLMNGVTLLCDIRRNPISRKYGFSKSTLSKGCEGVGIRYEHLPELGIASDQRQNLKTQEDHEALFEDYRLNCLPRQHKALKQICAWTQEGNHVALTCYERFPQMCHRSHVAQALEKEFNSEIKTTHL